MRCVGSRPWAWAWLTRKAAQSADRRDGFTQRVTRFACKSAAISISGRESRSAGIAIFSASSFRLRPAFGDPGLHLVVEVGEIVLGDFIGGGGPNAFMSEDVAQRLVKMLGRVRPADIVRVQRQ